MWAVKLADEVTYKRYDLSVQQLALFSPSIPFLDNRKRNKGGFPYTGVNLTDAMTVDRMKITMEKLQRMSESEYSSFIRVLFGLASPSTIPEDLSSDPEVRDIEWVDPSLNDSQKDAIRFALLSREIALIHGPPGVRLFLYSSHSSLFRSR